jgi:hybrid cluster-associated redox disulfide protein
MKGEKMAVKARTQKVKTEKSKITKDMKISEVAMKWPKTQNTFMEMGLYCFGCGVARFETIEEGAAAHGISVDDLLKALNEVANS